MLEFILAHDGTNWIARSGSLRIAAATLEKLDTEVASTLRKNGYLADRENKKVLMTFDRATIPQWIRQYAPHYFNRVIVVSGK